jgi:transposase
MATRCTDEFQRDAVRIATTSGLMRPPVSSDLGVGLSTLNKWVQKCLHDDLMIIIVAPVVRATMAMP